MTINSGRYIPTPGAACVLDRLRERINAKTDKELAAALGVSYGVLRQWRHRNSANWPLVIGFCQVIGFDLNEALRSTS